MPTLTKNIRTRFVKVCIPGELESSEDFLRDYYKELDSYCNIDDSPFDFVNLNTSAIDTIKGIGGLVKDVVINKIKKKWKR